MKQPRTELKNLSKTMGKDRALRSVSTVFEPALVHGIIGPNGAGKTTLMRLLAGLLSPTSGKIEFSADGKILSGREAKNITAYFPQEPSLYPDLSCDEHLAFFADLYGINEADFKTRRAALYEATGMGRFAARPAGKLSGGMYKKLGLMCVLLNRPSLLLLDEPTVGVDPVSRRQLWDLVYGFAAEGMTVIVSTSYMDEAARCSKIHLLDEGVLLASGAPEDISKQFNVQNFADIFLRGGDKDDK